MAFSGFDVNTTGEQVLKLHSQQAKGKTVVITGPSRGGIGAELALTLARASPAELILLGRNRSKIEPVVQDIQAIDPKIKTRFIQCDLSDNATVRSAAEEINSSTSKVDVLVNCAGIMAIKDYTESRDGVELQFAASHLGHFLLTNLLIDRLIAAKGVVINMTSSAYALAETNTSDPNFDSGKTYNLWTAYGRTKTANILFTYGLNQKFGAKGVAALATDPGMVMESNLMANSNVTPQMLQEGVEIAIARNGGKPIPKHPHVSLQQGIATTLLAALDPAVRSEAPAFMKECRVEPVIPYASDATEAKNLWTLSEKLLGQTF